LATLKNQVFFFSLIEDCAMRQLLAASLVLLTGALVLGAEVVDLTEDGDIRALNLISAKEGQLQGVRN